MGKFGGNGERRKKRRRGRKVMSSNKGELSQLITFPAKRREEGSLKWCETPRAISGRREGGRACCTSASLDFMVHKGAFSEVSPIKKVC